MTFPHCGGGSVSICMHKRGGGAFAIRSLVPGDATALLNLILYFPAFNDFYKLAEG